MFTSIFGFLFIILIVVFLFGVSIISSIFKALFGFGKRSSASSRQDTGKQQSAHAENMNQESKKKKLFDDDEGEYVDFEEVKQDGQ